MQNTKIIFTAAVTTIIVGIINTTSAVVAYKLLVPEVQTGEQTLLADDNGEAEIIALPTPTQSVETNTGQKSPSTATTGENIEFRAPSAKLEAGSKPQPTGVITAADGTVSYKWCSGVNPELPDKVCEAIVSIAANPVESNPHLSSKVRQSLSLLPQGSSITMDENSWQSTGADSGNMLITASTAQYGNVTLKIYLEKKQDMWVLTDGQLA